MKKHTFYTEAAYAAGLLLIAAGVSLMEKANFGMSMIVAPAYVLHRWLQPVWGWFTFGAAEYCFQALLLVIMSLALGRFRISWLCSFVTAVVYGFVLDGLMLLAAPLPTGMVWRVVWYVLGMAVCSLGVACMFRTYLSPEVYELLVKEGSRRYGVEIHRFKTGYDCASCLLAVVMSFVFFGLWQFVGVQWGTIFCALINGWLIGQCSRLLEKCFVFKDALPWRGWFEQQ